MNMRLCRFWVLCAGLLLVFAPSASVFAQTAAGGSISSSSADNDQDAATTLSRLIATEARQRDALAALLEEQAASGNPVRLQELTTLVEQAQLDLAQTGQRIEELASGIPPGDFDLGESPPFNLQSELQQLAEPFVAMMKSATENARQIERLRQLEQTSREQQGVAARAVRNIEGMMQQATDPATIERLAALRDIWSGRADAAQDLVASTSRQVEARLAAEDERADGSGAAFRDFVNVRGRNLAMGIGAFILVTALMRLVGRIAGATTGTDRPRGFSRRLVQLVFAIATVLLAVGSMLVVFNLLNDWLLLGLGILLLLAMLWFVLKTLPSLVEQATLLLNLGAVQEGERIMFNGVPFLVQRLDYYTDLVNPKLRGGEFTIPVRELAGYHSRPVAEDEVWFPADEGDVVMLEDERWGRVTFQSPEAVRLEEEGGAVTTFETAAFIGLNPKNLSRGFRTEFRFGVDYAHQAIATTEIPRILKAEITAALAARYGAENIRATEVEFCEAGDSSLNYDIEADMTGNMAWQVDEIKHALVRYAVECCTRHGWNIPFPHVSVHKLS